MLHVWGIARSKGAKVICRVEDHDLSRRRPEYEEAILENMEWLGFVPDEGLRSGGTTSVSSSGRNGARPSIIESSEYRQSDCGDHYERTLGLLAMQGLVYGCECTRRQIRGGSAAPLTEDAEAGVPPATQPELCYKGTCSDKGLPLVGHTVRFRVPSGEVVFDDLRLGRCLQAPKQQCGDFSLRDREGHWTYQFACVCDDIRQGVDLVIRGEDILASTARQIMLFKALDAPLPAFLHHPLLCDEKGEKLSKRQRSESISQLREAGMKAEEVLGRALYAAQLSENEGPVDLVEALAIVGGTNKPAV
jgi:glutamyl-tRNA synthetase/glutamyl-Q tRNA(Asp) synthetase